MRTARVSIPGMAGIVEACVQEDGRRLGIGSRSVPAADARFAPASDGLVYGVILNDEESLRSLGPVLAQPPYQSPPRAPALYIKPYNTHAGHAATVFLPPAAERVDVCGTLGIVFGAPATRVPEVRALETVRGFTVVADLSLPHASLHRPPIREKCFDGACPIGPWVVDREEIGDPDALEVLVHVNAELRARRSLRGLLRGIPRLIADVTEFLTLYPGDVLLAGVPVSNPSARPGDSVAVEIPGVGVLETKIGSLPV